MGHERINLADNGVALKLAGPDGVPDDHSPVQETLCQESDP
jgi:hypothetical protein